MWGATSPRPRGSPRARCCLIYPVGRTQLYSRTPFILILAALPGGESERPCSFEDRQFRLGFGPDQGEGISFYNFHVDLKESWAYLGHLVSMSDSGA